MAVGEPPGADSGSAAQDIEEQPVQAAPMPDGDEPEMAGGGGAVQSSGIVSMESVADMRNLVGYDFKMPTDLPDGYVLEDASLVFGIIQLSYESADDTITYRTQKTDEDISGDYNVYTDVKTVKVGDVSVTVRRGGEHTTGAIWTDQGYSFSVYADSDLTEDAVLAIVKSVR